MVALTLVSATAILIALDGLEEPATTLLEAPTTRPDILVIGLGGVGSWVLELLARTPGISYIVGADFNVEWGHRKVYTVASGAALQGLYPRLDFEQIDLRAVEATAETIHRLQPRLIFNAATQQTWWIRRTHLSTEQADRLAEAGAGPWLPTHMALARKLMFAVRDSGWQGPVINSGFADASNAVLAKRGLAPTAGLGNIDLIIPNIQLGVAQRLTVAASSVSVYAILHHYHVSAFHHTSLDVPPYFLRILVGDREVTGQFDTDRLLYEVSQDRLSGEHVNAMVAASGVKNALALLGDADLITHANGPQGLPGGYPVRINAAGVEVFLPEGVTLEQAVRINEVAQRGDGIDRIEDDGTVVYTDKAVEILNEVLGYELTPLRFEDCDVRAAELIDRFESLARQ